MKYILLFVLLITFNKSNSQFNYSFTNVFFKQQTYQDISSTGLSIPVNPITNTPTTPQNIGFTFLYNGVSFTQFSLNKDGIVRLGTSAPESANTFNNHNDSSFTDVFTSESDLSSGNLLMPFFSNLISVNSSENNFHVQTSGTSPNRICTIQFKNLKDDFSNNQYSNIEFQIKLFETSNDIEFVYGNFIPSNNSQIRKYANVGIKASNELFIFASKRASHGWKTAEYYNKQFSEVPGFAYTKNVIPIAGESIKFYGKKNKDVGIAQLFVDRTIAKESSSAQQIAVMVTNHGNTIVENIPVTIAITGANSFSETINIATLQPGASQIVSPTSFEAKSTGNQVVEVSINVPDDENLENDSRSTIQTTSANTFRLADTSLFSGFGFGFNQIEFAGLQAQKVYASGKNIINQIAFKTNTFLSKAIFYVYEDDGTNNSPGTVKYKSEQITTDAENTRILTLKEPVELDGNFYIGVEQIGNKNIGLMVSNRFPIQSNRQYTGNGVLWSETTTHSGILYFEASRQIEGVDLGITNFVSPGCNYSENETVSVSLKNYGKAEHNFATNPVTITAFAKDPNNNIFHFPVQIKNTGTLASNAIETITLSTSYNTIPRGLHFYSAKIQCAADAAPENDSIGFYMNNKLAITKSITDSICPSSPIQLTGATSYTTGSKWSLNGEAINYNSTITVSPTATTTYYYESTDYRGCTLKDSVTVGVKALNVPAKPIVHTTGNTLRGSNHFRDTLSTTPVDDHSYLWLESGASYEKIGPILVVGPVSNSLIKYAVQVKRLSDGCTNLSDPISIEYAPGVIPNNAESITICDTSFYDLGGASGLTGNNFTKTFFPETAGSKLKLSFYQLELAQFASITIYDGISTNDPRIDILNTTENGTDTKTYVASNTNGALTVQFRIGSSQSSGWLAGFSCQYPQIFRTVASGDYIDKTIWESKSSNTGFKPAASAPSIADDSIYISHKVVVNTPIQADQVLIESTGHVWVKENASIRTSLLENQSSFNVKGIIENDGQIFGGGIMHVSGELKNNGRLSFDTVYIDGTKPQIISGVNNGQIDNLVMNNTFGLTILGSQKISHLLSLQKGLIHTSKDNTLTLLNRPLIEGGSNESFVNGPLRASSSYNYFFPIGKAGSYRPISLAANSNSSEGLFTFEAEVIAGAPTTRTLPNTIAKVSEKRHYKINPIGENDQSSFNITIPYNEDEVVGNLSELRIAKDDGGNNWIDLGGFNNGENPGTITSYDFDTFSDFVLDATTDGILPITITIFNGFKTQEGIELKWNVSNGTTIATYTVERSIDGSIFNSITSLRNHELAQDQQFFNYIDKNLPNGSNTLFYRLKMIDKNGNITYSTIVSIQMNILANAGVEKLYPNPFTNKILISYNSSVNEDLKIEITDISSKKILLKKIPIYKGNNQLQLMLPQIPKGVYMISISSNNHPTTHRKIIRE